MNYKCCLCPSLTCGPRELHAHLVEVGRLGGDLPDVGLVDADEDVLWLDVGVDDLALGVQVVEALEHLPHYQLHVLERDALVVAPDDELEEVVAQHLEHHAHVSAVNAAYLEVVQKLHAPLAVRVGRVALSDLQFEFECYTDF